MRSVNTPGQVANHQEFDPSCYPRTYRASKGNQLIWIMMATAAAIGGLFGAFYFGTGNGPHAPAQIILLISTSLLFVLLGGYIVLWMVRSRIILTTDALEVREVLSARIMRRNEIAVWRILPTQYISTLELTSSGSGEKRFKFGLMMKTDSQFQAWFAGIPDLDMWELARSEAQIEANEDLGLTPSQRAGNLAEAKKIAAWLNRISFAVVFWGGWFYPHPYRLAILSLAILPVVVIVLLARTQGVYQVEGRRNDARPSLALPIIVPEMILVLRSLEDFQFLLWKPLLA